MTAHKTPRITISLPPEVLDTYRAYAKVEGRPTATAISNMLVEVAPFLARSVVLIEAATRSKDQTRQEIVKGYVQALDDLKSIMAGGDPDAVQLDDLMQSMMEPRTDPRASNTGGKNVPPTSKGA